MNSTYVRLTDYNTGNCFEVNLIFKVRPGQAPCRYRDGSWEAPVPPEVDLIDAKVLCFWHWGGSKISRAWLKDHGFNLDKIALRVAIDDLMEGDAIFNSLVEEMLDETF